MKRIVVSTAILITALLAVQTGWAATITLQWNANTESDLAGYNLYYGTQPRTAAPYSEVVAIQDPGATQWSITLPDGSYYLALTARDSSGNESLFSQEVASVQPETTQVTLQWTANTETDLAGYRLYYGTQSRTVAPYTEMIAVDNKNTTAWRLELAPGTYYVALTARDTTGNESAYSVEVSTAGFAIPGKPGQPILISMGQP